LEGIPIYLDITSSVALASWGGLIFGDTNSTRDNCEEVQLVDDEGKVKDAVKDDHFLHNIFPILEWDILLSLAHRQ
jgi:hypothetical protein